eukprot:14676731-Heterocapsa_arctica.AAC.1
MTSFSSPRHDAISSCSKGVLGDVPSPPTCSSACAPSWPLSALQQCSRTSPERRVSPRPSVARATG